MKKLLLAGVLIGSLNFAQATSITLSTADLHGANAYEYLVSMTSGQTISSASLVFNLTLTASGYNTFSYDLINGNVGTANTLTTIPTEGDHPGDYFQTLGLGSALTVLGSHTFPSLNSNWSSTYDFGAAGTLAALNIAAADGRFDFGFDPDCTYSGSIVFNYTTQTTTNHTSVPDSATTCGMLGVSLLGLFAIRRKLCVN